MKCFRTVYAIPFTKLTLPFLVGSHSPCSLIPFFSSIPLTLPCLRLNHLKCIVEYYSPSYML